MRPSKTPGIALSMRGEAEAEKRLERVNDQRGYNLPTEIEQEKTGHQSGLIRYGDWFGKFFEYGTVYIAPQPVHAARPPEDA